MDDGFDFYYTAGNQVMNPAKLAQLNSFLRVNQVGSTELLFLQNILDLLALNKFNAVSFFCKILRQIF